MSEKFVRPSHIPYPNVWLTFDAPDDNGDLVKYRIQDLPEERFEDAIKHMRANFLLDETLCRARNMANDEQSVIDFTSIWREAIFDCKLTLVCFQEGSDDIVGMNVLYIEEKNALSDWSEVKQHIKLSNCFIDLRATNILVQKRTYQRHGTCS